MKTLLLTLLFTFTLQAKMVTDTFTDKINAIKETPDGIKVAFEIRAAFYKLKKSNPNFVKLKNELEEMQKNNKKIKITALVPSMEIQEIKAE